MIDVLYLSAVVSPTQFDAIERAKKPDVQSVTYGMPQSGQKFGWLIQSGLAEYPGVRLTALSGRSVHPRFHHGRFWSRSREPQRPNWVIDHLGFPNATGLRQAWLAGQFALSALRWRWQTRSSKQRVFIADAAYVTALPGVLLALTGSKVKKVAIFADVYSYMGDVQDASTRGGLLVRAIRRLARAAYDRLDGFVLLTEAMNQVVNPLNRPHMIMEGLVDLSEASATPRQSRTQHPTILYAGALRSQYGLADLVEGFASISEPTAQLIVYGDGDYVEELRAACQVDPRIDFRGTVPTDEVVDAERRAWLLVNPRPPDQEFTKYSFPSKNMEYLASGTAVLTTRLPGMPAEYLPHVLTVDAPGHAGIAAALKHALGLGLEELQRRGRDGQSFVLEYKNNRRQAARILEFARGL